MARARKAAVPVVKMGGRVYPTGWIDDHRKVDQVMGILPHPVFGITARPIKDTGKGKIALLYLAVRQVTGGDICHLQTIGDCISQGWSLLVDVVKCNQIANGLREKFTGLTATEVIYAGARHEVGQDQVGRGDGAVGAWASLFVSTFGTLVRGRYGDIDLSTYDGNRARAWGMPGVGIPDELEPIIREHPIRTVSMVQSYAEARDAICNGHPVACCSNRGFRPIRDAEGFAMPEGEWGHCTCFIGVDDASGRPGLLDMNSWGPDWIDGPKRHDQPDGSFWVDAEVVDEMFAEQDSFAGSGYNGFPRIDHDFLRTA
jgi:hypothetical protein